MPNNPLTQAELTAYTSNTLYPQIPAGYFFASPPTGAGPLAYRLFDASYISIGIINPNRLGTGSTGAGNLYLADNGTWKSITVATPTLAQVTTAGNTTTNSITVGGLTVATNLIYTDTVNNRVGIGTNSPSVTLNVQSGGSTPKALFQHGTLAHLGVIIGSVGGGFTVEDNNFFAIWHQDYANRSNETGLTERMRITTGGNILIGTTTDSGYKLDVNGTFKTTAFWTTSSGRAQWGNSLTAYGTLTWDTGYARIHANSGNRLDLGASEGLHMSISTTGNVGIGTTLPTARLQIEGSTTAATGVARGAYLNQTLVAQSNNDTLIGLDIASTFTTSSFTNVQQYGLRLVNSASAPAAGSTNSPSLILQGSAWNSATGPTTMTGGMVVAARTYPSIGTNINPPVSKISFLVGANSTVPTEKMSIDSDGRLLTYGGFVGYAPSNNNIYNFTLDISGSASVGTPINSNKIVLKGRVHNSVQGSSPNMAYLMLSNVVTNANPTTDKLSFYVGSAVNTNNGDTDGNATERLALRTDGIFSFFNSSVTEVLRLFNTGNLVLQNGGTFTDAGYKLDVAGNIIARNSYPSIYVDHSGTIMGGIRSDATNKLEIKTLTTAPLSFQVNSSEKMRITNDGYVGINTTTPTERLQVAGNVHISGVGSALYFDTDASPKSIVQYVNNLYELHIYNGRGITSRIIGGNSFVSLGSGTTQMLYLNTSTGNVLIGTTTDGGYKLDVNGTARVQSNFTVDTDTLFVDAANNRVGVGTTSPQIKLEVRGLQNNTVAPANGVAKFVGNDAGIFIGNLAGTPNYSAWIQAMRESDALAFPLLLQPTGGNVGIGSTSTPSEKLTVVGNGLFTSTTGASLSIGTGYQPGTTASPLYTNLNFRGYADTIKAQIKSYDVSTNAGGGIMVFSVASTSDVLTEYMRITTSGNLGIGTSSPNSKLDVRGVIESSDGTIRTVLSYTAAGGVVGTLTNHPYIFYANNGERMRLAAGGNLLVGTTTDSGYKLNVNGTAYIGGVATLNSDANIAGSVATPQITARKYYQNTNGVPTSNLGTPTITEMALFEAQFNNKTGFYNPANLTFWTSSDGVNYTEYTGFSTTEKKKFLGGDIESNIYIPNLTTRFRIELENSGNYVFLNQLYMYWSSNSHSTQVHIWKQRCDNGVWYQHTNSTTPVGAWPGHLYLPFDTIPYLPLPSTSSIHFNRIRIEFIPTWSGDPTWGSQHISLYRMQIWGGYPAGRRTLYSTDENQNVGFPANIYAAGTLTSTGVFTASNTSTFAQLATFNNGISSRSAAPTITLDRNGSYSWRLIVGDGTTYPTSTLNVVTNGGTAITTFLDSGKVGIGTASPGAKLEIDGNSYTTGLRISNTTSHSTNLFQSNTVFNINSQFVGDSISIQPANYLSISTYSGGIVERLRVVNNGNVLINTTTDSGYKLDVNGTARIQGNTTITGTLTTAPTYTNCGLTASVNVAQDTTEVLGFESKIDPNGWWNPGTKRWTPTVYGFYYVTLQVKWDPGTPGNQINIQILRNGGTVALCQDPVPTTVGLTQTTNAIIEMNGTTDYVTFTGYSSSTTGEFIVGEPQGNWTFFNAFRLN